MWVKVKVWYEQNTYEYMQVIVIIHDTNHTAQIGVSGVRLWLGLGF